jgi:hypothetical protein
MILCGVTCILSGKDNRNSGDIPDVDKSTTAEIEQTSDKTIGHDFFIIPMMRTADAGNAAKNAWKLRDKGLPSGFLWIPDYHSLERSELFQVFIGPFNDLGTAMKYLEEIRKTDKNAFVQKAGHSPDRMTVKDKFDIRINGKKQFLILTYSKPEDEKRYADAGGEDWAWFINDVYQYFHDHYPDSVLMSSVQNGWLSPSEIRALESELSLENFGYVLIRGKNKVFIPHSMPEEVIRSACKFFTIEYREKHADNSSGK